MEPRLHDPVIQQLRSDMERLEAQSVVLDAAIQSRNTIELDEFMRFAPLYRNGGDGLSEQEIYELTQEFTERFSVYVPITIVENREVVGKLPAIFYSIDPLNSRDEQVNESMAVLANAYAHHNPLRNDLPEAVDSVRVSMAKVADTNRLKQAREEFATLAKQFERGAPAAVETTSVDLDWE